MKLQPEGDYIPSQPPPIPKPVPTALRPLSCVASRWGGIETRRRRRCRLALRAHIALQLPSRRACALYRVPRPVSSRAGAVAASSRRRILLSVRDSAWNSLPRTVCRLVLFTTVVEISSSDPTATGFLPARRRFALCIVGRVAGLSATGCASLVLGRGWVVVSWSLFAVVE